MLLDARQLSRAQGSSAPYEAVRVQAAGCLEPQLSLNSMHMAAKRKAGKLRLGQPCIAYSLTGCAGVSGQR